VPAAFAGGDFTAITIGYLIMRVGLVAQWVRAGIEHADGRATAFRYAAGITLVQVGWVSRLALPAEWGGWTFLVLAALDLSVPVWAERTGKTSWHPHHIAERYGLFTIIVLGESVSASAIGVQKGLADSGVTALPAGAVQDAANGFIWPVNGPIVSPFGMRWGQLHAGVDIAVPTGTPIRAAKAGTIVLNQTEAESGGYGNYTCIDHGSGVSTCYAHQSAFAITSGSVDQGEVIGYVGCTGHCFGPHLHFEVRINGVPTDPMGFL